MTDQYVVPPALRGSRFIPHQRPGARPYLMVGNVSAYRLGKPHDWWGWDADGDEYIRKIGAELHDPNVVKIDCDVPLLPDGTPEIDGFRRLMDFAMEAGEIPDVSTWCMVRTPGHAARDGGPAKGPGWHLYFRADPGYPVCTGALERCKAIEVKAQITAPGSPGYKVVRCPDELPVLPRWLAELIGRATPGNRSTGYQGYSITAGQGVVCDTGRNTNNASTCGNTGGSFSWLRQHCDEITDPIEIKKRLWLYRNTHPNSTDWKDAPPQALGVAETVLNRVAATGAAFRSDFPDVSYQIWAWLCLNAPVLTEHDDGRLGVLGPPDPPRKTAVNRNLYPGAPANVDPAAGQYLGSVGYVLVCRAMELNPDRDFTNTELCHYVNSVLMPELRLTEYGGEYRYMSIGVCSKNRMSMMESGYAHVSKLPEMYVLNFQVRSTAPLYRFGEDPDPENQALMDKWGTRSLIRATRAERKAEREAEEEWELHKDTLMEWARETCGH